MNDQTISEAAKKATLELERRGMLVQSGSLTSLLEGVEQTIQSAIDAAARVEPCVNWKPATKTSMIGNCDVHKGLHSQIFKLSAAATEEAKTAKELATKYLGCFPPIHDSAKYERQRDQLAQMIQHTLDTSARGEPTDKRLTNLCNCGDEKRGKCPVHGEHAP